jgi:putative ABC transport system permease protein
MKSWPAPTLWKYTAREIQRRPGRTLLTLLGIVIGVAASVAISLTVQATRQAHRAMFEVAAGRAALEVIAEGMGGFEEKAASPVKAIPGVRAAVPVIQTPAALIGAGGAVPVMVLGVDPRRDRAARDYFLREGRPLGRGDGLLLETGFAGANHFALGNKVRLMTTTEDARLPVVGLLEPQGAAAFNGGAVAFMTLSTAQRLFGLKGKINSLELVLAEDADPRQVAMGRDLMAVNEQGLATLSVGSLVAGAFVILNAFLMSLGERRRQLAILRALGATRSQVTRLLLREALLLGGAGTVIGLAVGWGLAVGLHGIMARLLAVTLPELSWSPEPFLLGLILGPGMALAATYLPARRAGRRAPLEDLLHQRGLRTEEVRRWPGYVGLAFLIVTLFLVLGIVRDWFPAAVGLALTAPATGLFLVGCVLIVPLILRPLMRLAGRSLTPLLGTEGKLAMRQLQRHQGRTALTVGVLLIGVVFAVGFGQSLVNNVRHIHEWIDNLGVADFYLRGAWPDAAASITTAALPEAAADEVAALDSRVERVDKFRYILTRAGGRPVAVMAYTFAEGRPAPLTYADGDPREVVRRLVRGEVVIGTALGQRLGLARGDRITVETPHGPRALRIAGTIAEYTGGGIALYLDWATAKRLFDLKDVHTLLVSVHKGEAAVVGPRLKEYCDRHGYLFQSHAELRRTLDEQMAGFLGLVWSLVGLVFVVAGLGVVNTLTMNVLEQTRELGTLRAVGMKRGQVRKLVLAQAVALGVISLMPGVVGGIILAYLVNLTTYPLMGQPVGFHLDGWLVAGGFLAGMVIALLAALLPARRAVRLQVIEALQYE